MKHPATLVLIMAAAVLAPLLAHAVGRRVRVPLVIFEIALGILLGPDVLGWAHPDAVVDTLSDLGLSMLIFLAGYEIDFATIRGDTLRRSLRAWLLSLVLGIGFAFLISGADMFKAFVIGTALTSTALGTVLPMLRDQGLLRGRFGTVMSAFGAVGEFGPVVAVALLLSGRRPGESAALLAGFGVLTAGAVLWALRPRPPWFTTLTERTLHSSGQFAVRFVMLLLACMLGLSAVFGLDVLLGAFAAGVLTRLVLLRAAPASSDEVLGKIEAMGFGFLVPLFYVVTGIEFDLDALLHDPLSLLLLPAFLLLFLLVRGARPSARPEGPRPGRAGGARPLRLDLSAPRRGHHHHRPRSGTPRRGRGGGARRRRDDLRTRPAAARHASADGRGRGAGGAGPRRGGGRGDLVTGRARAISPVRPRPPERGGSAGPILTA